MNAVEVAAARTVLPETVRAVEDAYPRVEEPERVRPTPWMVPVNDGDAEKTTFPVPVSSESHCANCDEFVKKVEVATVSAPLERVSPAPVISVR